MKNFLYLLFFTLITFGANAQVVRGYSMTVPPSGPYITTSGNFSGFSTTSGTASPSQSFTFLSGSLTTNLTWTGDSVMEVSKDNSTFSGSISYTPSSGIASGTVYARIKSTVLNGSYSGNILGASSGASSINKPYSSVVGSLPSMSVSTNTITNLNSVTGSPSTPQTFVVTFGNLSGSVTVNNFSPVEVSQDNTTYSSSVSFSTGSPKTVYVRESASAPPGSISGTLVVSASGVSNQNIAVSGTVSSTQSAIFNFSSTGSTVAGATNFFGDPTTALSFTDPTTGWTLQSITSGWNKFSGTFGGVGNGATTASTDGTFTQPQIASNLFNYNVEFSGTYQLNFTNLPAGTYAIYLLGSIPTATFANGGNMQFHVLFGTGSDNFATFNPNDNKTTSGPGTVTSGSFSGTITSGQLIKVALTPVHPGQLGFISAIKIVKIG